MGGLRFSANTGFLWPHLGFIEKISVAKAAGFAALEFHDEALDADPVALKEALERAGLPVCGMNVRMGDSMGCAAIPGRGDEARRGIARALRVASDFGVGKLHVLAGKTRDAGARAAFVANLEFALENGDRDILIEPICRAAAPEYFLNRLEQAREIVQEVGNSRLSIMFDCYHVLMEEGALIAPFDAYRAQIGHIQIAARKGRAEPGVAGPDYSKVLPHMVAGGYDGVFGCEYRQSDARDMAMDWRRGLMAAIEEKQG
jgi:hydroxypyruvate isomerase